MSDQPTINYICMTCPKCGGSKINTLATRFSGVFRIRYHVCDTPTQKGTRQCGHRFRSRERVVS